MSITTRIGTVIAASIPIDVFVAGVSEFEAGKDANGSAYRRPARDGRAACEGSPA